MNHINDLGLTDVNASGMSGGCGCGGSAGGCHCGGHEQSSHAHSEASDTHASAAPTMAAAGVRAEYLVDGMTCAHCVSSVTEEVGALEGVESVSVQLNAGGTSRVTVTSPTPIPVEGIRSAVDEAGYRLVDA